MDPAVWLGPATEEGKLLSVASLSQAFRARPSHAY